MAAWVAAGAQGFGIGAALYAPGVNADEVARRAHAFAQAWAAVFPKSQEHRA
jgi:2-dehydro-3-deoxyphosphogalactonate aldolase